MSVKSVQPASPAASNALPVSLRTADDINWSAPPGADDDAAAYLKAAAQPAAVAAPGAHLLHTLHAGSPQVEAAATPKQNYAHVGVGLTDVATTVVHPPLQVDPSIQYKDVGPDIPSQQAEAALYTAEIQLAEAKEPGTTPTHFYTRKQTFSN